MALVTKSYSRTVTRLTAAVCVDMMRLLERSVVDVGALSVPRVLPVTRLFSLYCPEAISFTGRA